MCVAALACPRPAAASDRHAECEEHASWHRWRLGSTEAACVVFGVCGAGLVRVCVAGCTLVGASAGARAAAAAAVCRRCSSSKKLPTRSTSPCSDHACGSLSQLTSQQCGHVKLLRLVAAVTSSCCVAWRYAVNDASISQQNMIDFIEPCCHRPGRNRSNDCLHCCFSSHKLSRPAYR